MCLPAWPQIPGKNQTPAPATAQQETSKDALGRTTPRGAVLGFLAAARKGNDGVAAQYLDTRLRGKAAEQLANKLFVVLDRRLPARLNEISDTPEGTPTDLLNPRQDLVGTIQTADGRVDIIVERVERGKAGPIWLFSRETLNSIPAIYDEVSAVSVDTLLPEWMVNTRLGGIPLFQWLAVLVGMPLVYLLTGLLGHLIGRLVNFVWRRLFRKPSLSMFQVLPAPVRLILLGLVIRWMLFRVNLPLLARQFWATVATVIFIASITWLLILLTGWLERLACRRLQRRNLAGTASMLRLMRGVVNVLLVFAGLLVMLHHFGVNLTAALAGLGVGGIAVALAAQKTLENVIGGASLIFDKAMNVGEFVKIGDTVGTVEEIGLRSTRIRTLDRSVLSVPNGQLANFTLESLSARDKFWLHPTLRLKYGITSAEINTVLEGIRKLLDRSPAVESGSLRVRLLNLAPSFLEIEVFAYIYARDWSGFLEIQEGLLLEMMACIEGAGAEIALPSQTIFLASGAASLVDGGKTKTETPLPEKKPSDERTAVKSA
jgi:MscS family membrane protein